MEEMSECFYVLLYWEGLCIRQDVKSSSFDVRSHFFVVKLIHDLRLVSVAKMSV